MLAYLLDHSSLGLLTPQDALDNGRIRTDLATGWTGGSGGGNDTADDGDGDDDEDDDRNSLGSRSRSVLLRCRRLRPEVFERGSGSSSSSSSSSSSNSNKRSSTAAALAARVQEAVPGGNVALSGAAKVLQKLPAVVCMLGSLQPRSQRFPADVAVSE